MTHKQVKRTEYRVEINDREGPSISISDSSSRVSTLVFAGFLFFVISDFLVRKCKKLVQAVRENYGTDGLLLVLILGLAIILDVIRGRNNKVLRDLMKPVEDMTDLESTEEKKVIEVKDFKDAFRDLTETEQEWYEKMEAELDNGEIDHELKIGEEKQIFDGTKIERTEDGIRLYYR